MIRHLVLAGIAVLALATPAAAQEHAAHMDHGPTLFHKIVLEASYEGGGGGTVDWDLHGWIGGDAERIWLRSEGDIADGATARAEAALLYGWNIADFWDVVAGVRHDFEPGGRTYAAVGLVGMLPYFVDTEATLYVSEDGGVSGRLKHDFELRLTQLFVLRPALELNLAARDDASRGTGAGISDVEVALQARYEIVREVAPFVEIAWDRKVGETSLIARTTGAPVEETHVRLGVTFWF